MRYLKILGVMTALCALFLAPTSAQDDTVVDLLAESNTFETLVAAVQAADLVDALSSEGPFTVFAPTDAAFAEALAALEISAEDLLADTATLTNILTYHVLEGAFFAEDVAGLDGQSTPTLNGAALGISMVEDAVLLNDSVSVTTPDVEASNGVIHVIDAVLLPPADGAMAATVETEPTPEATEAPIEATQEAEAMQEAEATQETASGAGTIVDIAASIDSFSILVAAVEAADLVDVLSADDPLTVFAPTDEAFTEALAALGLTAEDLLADTETLTSILSYHVVAGAQDAAALVDNAGGEIEALSGETIALSLSDGSLRLNGLVNVTAADIIASNGLIHVIDAVLLPDDLRPEESAAEAQSVEAEATEAAMAEMTPEAEATEATEATAQTIIDIAQSDESFSTLVAAVEAAELVETLNGEGPFTVFAPTDEAFSAALAALDLTAEDLLADTDMLTSILAYHVLEGAVQAETALSLDGTFVQTLNGASIDISVVGGSLVLNETVNVTATDIIASNGVIHVIDGVLLPPADG